MKKINSKMNKKISNEQRIHFNTNYKDYAYLLNHTEGAPPGFKTAALASEAERIKKMKKSYWRFW